ncbi:radical SAM protein [Candidatus Omnitrophota bacterium]
MSRVKLLIADKKGKIYDVPYLEGTGMKAGEYFHLASKDLIRLHPDSELFMLPERKPVGYDPERGRFVQLDSNPLVTGDEPCYAVSAFLPPGYTATYSASYRERAKARLLPLFSYAAVVFYRDEFYATGIRVDREKRQELKGMDPGVLRKNIKGFRKTFSKNRLVKHLETCALVYGCPAAKNFFLKRYECPLPTAPVCNSRCIGCISHQPGRGCSVTQPRIRFVPSPEEVAEVALFHIRQVANPIVSFGQGCEGEPLMVSKVLEEAVRLIRRSTSKGIINLNTNASKPDVIRRLFDEGMDSIRVSMNSVRKPYYLTYYKPRGYSFSDVLKSIKNAKKAGGFVSINYLVIPGFTDSLDEARALSKFLDKTSVDMIQWRNLNYDPVAYFKKLRTSIKKENMIEIDTLIRTVRREHPHLMHGYFNPSRERIRRAKRDIV